MSEDIEIGLFSIIPLPAGHKVGMGRLREPVDGKVMSIDHDDSGRPFYRVSFFTKGKERSTWVSADEAERYRSRGHTVGGRGRRR